MLHHLGFSQLLFGGWRQAPWDIKVDTWDGLKVTKPFGADLVSADAQSADLKVTDTNLMANSGTTANLGYYVNSTSVVCCPFSVITYHYFSVTLKGELRLRDHAVLSCTRGLHWGRCTCAILGLNPLGEGM